MKNSCRTWRASLSFPRTTFGTSDAFGAARDNKPAPLEDGAEDDAGGGLSRLGKSSCNLEGRKDNLSALTSARIRSTRWACRAPPLKVRWRWRWKTCAELEKLLSHPTGSQPPLEQALRGAASDDNWHNPPALQDEAENDAVGGLTQLWYVPPQFTSEGKDTLCASTATATQAHLVSLQSSLCQSAMMMVVMEKPRQNLKSWLFHSTGSGSPLEPAMRWSSKRQQASSSPSWCSWKVNPPWHE